MSLDTLVLKCCSLVLAYTLFNCSLCLNFEDIGFIKVNIKMFNQVSTKYRLIYSRNSKILCSLLHQPVATPFDQNQISRKIDYAGRIEIRRAFSFAPMPLSLPLTACSEPTKASQRSRSRGIFAAGKLNVPHNVRNPWV